MEMFAACNCISSATAERARQLEVDRIYTTNYPRERRDPQTLRLQWPAGEEMMGERREDSRCSILCLSMFYCRQVLKSHVKRCGIKHFFLNSDMRVK